MRLSFFLPKVSCVCVAHSPHWEHEWRDVFYWTMFQVTDTGKDRESEATRRVRQIESTLEEHGKMNFWQFILDPDSFSRSVENIFHFSFLIKDGRVSLQAENNSPVIRKSTFTTDIITFVCLFARCFMSLPTWSRFTSFCDLSCLLLSPSSLVWNL
jgi:hypothetical protein